MSEVDGVKNKLTNLSDVIRKNLLENSSDVTRKFIVDENDFLAILTLAIRFLHKKDEKPDGPPPTTSEQPPPPKDALKDNMKTVEGGGRNAPCGDDFRHVESKKLRTELLRVLSDHIYPEEAKTELLLDVFRRYENKLGVTRQQCLENRFQAQHPNVLVGGGKHNTENQIQQQGENKEEKTDSGGNHEKGEGEKQEEENDIVSQRPPSSSGSKDQHLILARTWLDNAVETIENCMQNKVNIIFLKNIKYHANKLSNFFEQKGILIPKHRAIFSPNKQFYIQNHSLFFVSKHSKEANLSFELTKLLVCISFTKSKIFKFLKYREKSVTQFSKQDKKFLQIFIQEFPINRHRIPCKTIRDFAKSQ